MTPDLIVVVYYKTNHLSTSLTQSEVMDGHMEKLSQWMMVKLKEYIMILNKQKQNGMVLQFSLDYLNLKVKKIILPINAEKNSMVQQLINSKQLMYVSHHQVNILSMENISIQKCKFIMMQKNITAQKILSMVPPQFSSIEIIKAHIHNHFRKIKILQS